MKYLSLGNKKKKKNVKTATPYLVYTANNLNKNKCFFPIDRTPVAFLVVLLLLLLLRKTIYDGLYSSIHL